VPVPRVSITQRDAVLRSRWLAQDPSVLRRIAKEFGGTMALDCDVVEGGRISVGDRVELL
jgi:hypothetical protein